MALAEQQAALRNFGLDLVLIIAMSDIFDFVDVALPRFVREVEAHVVALRNFSIAPARSPFLSTGGTGTILTSNAFANHLGASLDGLRVHFKPESRERPGNLARVA